MLQKLTNQILCSFRHLIILYHVSTVELFFLSGWYVCYSYMVKIVNEMANWKLYKFRQIESDDYFSFYRVQVFLWLLNGQILKRKDKLEGLKKHSPKFLTCRMLILSNPHYMEPCQWVMFLHIMDMVIRLVML